MAEVRCVGLPENNGAGGAEFAGSCAIEIWHIILEEFRAGGRAQAFSGLQILDGDWKAVERTSQFVTHERLLRLFCGFAGALGVERDKCVDQGLELFRSAENVVEELHWG